MATPQAKIETTAPHRTSNPTWFAVRSLMESRDDKYTPDGRRHRRYWKLFNVLIRWFGWVLWLMGLFQMGVRNALDLRVRRIAIAFDDLPEAFDGFTIMHLTDLHLDALDELPRRLLACVRGLDVDLCVLTGDYRYRVHGPFEQILPDFQKLANTIEAREGILATLGNHDPADMIEPLEDMGIQVLINETVSLVRGGEAIHVTGIDDVHYYFTADAQKALFDAPPGINIALVHSPELVHQAAEAGASLYLTGHTHGGQISLPGGRPILTNLATGRRFASGQWRCGSMLGYTSPGVGVSGLPVRFNTRGEVTVITLTRSRP